MLSENKEQFLHCFQSNRYRYIFLNLPQEENLEVILFILIPEIRVSQIHPKLMTPSTSETNVYFGQWLKTKISMSLYINLQVC